MFFSFFWYHFFPDSFPAELWGEPRREGQVDKCRSYSMVDLQGSWYRSSDGELIGEVNGWEADRFGERSGSGVFPLKKPVILKRRGEKVTLNALENNFLRFLVLFFCDVFKKQMWNLWLACRPEPTQPVQFFSIWQVVWVKPPSPPCGKQLLPPPSRDYLVTRTNGIIIYGTVSFEALLRFGEFKKERTKSAFPWWFLVEPRRSPPSPGAMAMSGCRNEVIGGSNSLRILTWLTFAQVNLAPL